MSIITITTYAAPVTIAALLALYLGYIARGYIDWPMILDGVLLALYLWRPGWVVLGAVALLGSVRHIDAWTLVAAKWFKCAEHQGWTLRLWLFLLPALIRYTNQKAHADIPGATIALPPMVEVEKKQPTLMPESEMPLLLGEGFKLLNSDPTAPHVGVIGATQLGKTTFVGVLLAHRQGNALVIATPKSEIDDPWFGAEVARPAASEDDMDYSPIDQAISKVHKEMLRRNMPGVRDRSGITLVLDEWHELAEIPGVVKKVVQMIRRGAAAGIRLILMSTDVNVKSWKMEGMAGVLDNLVFARVEDGRRWSLGRLDPNWRLLSPRRLDTGQVHGLAARVSLRGREWTGARVSVPPAGAGGLLGGLPASVPVAGSVGVVPEGVRVPVGGVGGMPPDPALQTQTNANKQTQTEAEQRIAIYIEWRAADVKKEQARTIRRSIGAGLDDAEWAEAGKRLTNGVQTT